MPQSSRDRGRWDAVAGAGEREATAQRPLGERVGEAPWGRRARADAVAGAVARPRRGDAGVELRDQRVVGEHEVDDVAELVQDDHVAVDRALTVELADVERDHRVVAHHVGEADRLLGTRRVRRARGVEIGAEASIMPSTSAISRWASGRAVAMAPRIQASSFGATPGANVSAAARLAAVTVGLAVARRGARAGTRSSARHSQDDDDGCIVRHVLPSSARHTGRQSLGLVLGVRR